MATLQQIKKLAQSLGATIDPAEYSAHDRSYSINAVAPDGKQWVNGQCINMLCVYYNYIPGNKAEQLAEFMQRISEGLEELDKTINPQ